MTNERARARRATTQRGLRPSTVILDDPDGPAPARPGVLDAVNQMVREEVTAMADHMVRRAQGRRPSQAERESPGEVFIRRYFEDRAAADAFLVRYPEWTTQAPVQQTPWPRRPYNEAERRLMAIRPPQPGVQPNWVLNEEEPTPYEVTWNVRQDWPTLERRWEPLDVIVETERGREAFAREFMGTDPAPRMRSTVERTGPLEEAYQEAEDL